VDGVENVCAISLTQVKTVDEQVFGVEQMMSRFTFCFGFHPDDFFKVNAVEWAQGDPETVIPRLKAGEGLLVADRFLTARGVGVGDTITLGVDDVTAEFEILGVISSAGLDISAAWFGIQNKYMETAISGVFMDFDVAAKTWSNPNAYFVQVDMRDDADDEALTKAIEAAVPGVQFNSAKWVQDTIWEFADKLLLVYGGASSVTLLLACLAVGQVLFTNIHGRRYEFGVMRAVGADRTRLGRLILLEAGLLAITGAICGSAMGLHLAYIDLLNLRQMMGIDVDLVIPWQAIGLAVGVQLGMALLAALPAVWKILRPTASELVAVGRNE
jgi:ABC-type antimicrobial peptide transport system permease subunit